MIFESGDKLLDYRSTSVIKILLFQKLLACGQSLKNIRRWPAGCSRSLGFVASQCNQILIFRVVQQGSVQLVCDTSQGDSKVKLSPLLHASLILAPRNLAVVDLRKSGYETHSRPPINDKITLTILPKLANCTSRGVSKSAPIPPIHTEEFLTPANPKKSSISLDAQLQHQTIGVVSVVYMFLCIILLCRTMSGNDYQCFGYKVFDF